MFVAPVLFTDVIVNPLPAVTVWTYPAPSVPLTAVRYSRTLVLAVTVVLLTVATPLANVSVPLLPLAEELSTCAEPTAENTSFPVWLTLPEGSIPNFST